jgi:hypothetical protein
MEDCSLRPASSSWLLRNVEVGDLHAPPSIRLLARDQAAKRAFADAAFLAEECDDNGYTPHHVALRRFAAQEGKSARRI